MCWFQKLFICCCKVVFPKINWTLLEDFLEILFLSLIFWCRGPRWLHTSVPICAHFVHFPTFDASPVPAGNYSLYCHEICIIVFMCECFNVQKLIMQQIPPPFFFFLLFPSIILLLNSLHIFYPPLLLTYTWIPWSVLIILYRVIPTMDTMINSQSATLTRMLSWILLLFPSEIPMRLS